MPADMPTDSFWDHFRQSGLVSEEQLRTLESGIQRSRNHAAQFSRLAEALTKQGMLTEWQAEMLLKGKHRGFHLGPHKILRLLGRGGMSNVFLAEHEMMRRRCAIKVLPSKYQNDSDLLGRFHLEAEAIAKLDHPHIVRAYDFNKDVRYDKEIHYLVMEYIDGQDLRQMIEEHGPLDYRKAADFICQAADGLAHAHAAGLVHRDIKPANLLVDHNGVLKILDLGLARFKFEGDHAWQTADGEQSAVGTADYVAPEQVMDSRNVDGRADIYSLGLTFYYLLTGHRPFPKGTLVELLMAHKTEKPEPISKLRPDVPTELIDIIDRMTAKQPIMRFQTAKEVAEAIQTWMKESESGREYTRISAIMAAAMRGKQTSSGDSTGTSALPTANADLELVFLDDERKPAKGREEGKMAESDRSGAAKPKERKPSASDSSIARAAKLPDLLADDAISASSDPRMLGGAASAGIPFAGHPPFKRSQKTDLLRSPWIWVGAAIAGFVVLLVLISLLLPSHTPSGPGRNELAPRKTDQTSSPREVPPTRATSPSRPPAEEAKPTDEQATPETPPLEPVDKDKLLANARVIAILLSRFDPKNPLTPIFKQELGKTIRQLGISLVSDRDGPNIMIFVMNATKSGNTITVTLSANLRCKGPDGKFLVVWRDKQELPPFPVTAQPKDLTAVTEAMNAFVQRFETAVRKAREKVKS